MDGDWPFWRRQSLPLWLFSVSLCLRVRFCSSDHARCRRLRRSPGDKDLRRWPPIIKNDCMFSRKAKPEPVQATSGRLEIEREGHVAYLEYTLAGKVLQLIHSEVPQA